MPAVRTASAPESVPKSTAKRIETGTASQKGHPRLIWVSPDVPRIATM